MQKLRNDSRISILSAGALHYLQDEGYKIIQIEHAYDGNYIVEIVEKAEIEKTPDIGELARQVVDGE